MLTRVFRHCAHLGRSLARALRHCLSAATKPAEHGVVAGAFADLMRGRPALVAEHAFLRQQLIVLQRTVQAPTPHPDRPRSARAAGQPEQRLAPGAAARPAGDPAPLASAGLPPLLATAITAPAVAAAEGGTRDDRPDPGDGRSESALGRRADPGRAAQARHPRRRDDGPAAHARRPPAAPDSPGRRLCATTPPTSGPATSCR